MKFPKKIIDANVLLRFFLADNPASFSKARNFIGRLEIGQEEALLTVITFDKSDFKKLKISFEEPA